MNWPTTPGDWLFIVGAILLTHGVFLIGAHMGLWGTNPQGHIELK